MGSDVHRWEGSMTRAATLVISLAFFAFEAQAQPRPATPQVARQVAPLAGSRVRTPRPTFRIAQGAGAASTLEVCADRACRRVLTSIPASAEQLTPSIDLPAGVVFWRLSWSEPGAAPEGGSPHTVRSPTWPLRIARASQASPRAQDAAVYVVSTHGAAPPRRPPMPHTMVDVIAAAGGARRGVASGARLTGTAAGDLDGDGRADLALATTRERATLVSIVRAGARPNEAPATFEPPSPPHAATASEPRGATLAIGDANGDGFDDLAVAPAEIGLREEGPIVVLLYAGGPSGVSAASPARIQTPRPAPPSAGAMEHPENVAVSIAFVDVDSDGHEDLAVTSPEALRVYRGTDAGLGAPAAWSLAPPSGASFEGSRVARAGDTNGDGYDDLAVAARSTAGPFGRVLVYLGSRSGPRPEPVALSAGEVPIGFGSAMAAAGDVDGDGFGELLVSFSGGEARQSAGVYLYRGTQRGPDPRGGTLLGSTQSPSDAFGAAIVGGRDIDGDGYADVIIGAPGAVRGRGMIVIHPGRPAAASRAITTQMPGRRAGYAFGAALAW
ncbi:MAG: VCBS repeat-containing protein [Deltaproteobacteria bacterium]|nr:VCBS repeat-containing protein [Deltaproteobacteria bacterium]